jgi:hypothetical protein
MALTVCVPFSVSVSHALFDGRKADGVRNTDERMSYYDCAKKDLPRWKEGVPYSKTL